MQKDDVVEINLPDELGMNKAGAHVLEAIHSIYSADRIENKLLIKVCLIIVYTSNYSLHAYISFIDLGNFILII